MTEPESTDPLPPPPTPEELERARLHRQILIGMMIVLVAAPLIAAVLLVLQ